MELLDNLPEDVHHTLWALALDPQSERPYRQAALPRILYRALCKANVPVGLQARAANHMLLRSIRQGDVVYVWPPYDQVLIQRAKDKGAIVIAERINCMGQMVRETLTRAYARRAMPLPPGWCQQEDIAKEREQMLECDFVTAPNPLVADSLRNAGISGNRIIETSYGYNPTRLAQAIAIRRPPRRPVFAFVGLGNVRKGLDVLLEAWTLANVGGRLLIAGHIDDEIRASYSSTLARDDVEALGHVSDIAVVYAAADVFVFPTHEEGGPQVTYEAAGCGLPSIVSPMGAGRILRDGQECLLVNPLDVDDVAGALQRMAEDRTTRETMAANAARRSLDFTWAIVGEQLYNRFLQVA
jgi:glycosyltransferase involved in cell wall biosynthesis